MFSTSITNVYDYSHENPTIYSVFSNELIDNDKLAICTNIANRNENISDIYSQDFYPLAQSIDYFIFLLFKLNILLLVFIWLYYSRYRYNEYFGHAAQKIRQNRVRKRWASHYGAIKRRSFENNRIQIIRKIDHYYARTRSNTWYISFWCLIYPFGTIVKPHYKYVKYDYSHLKGTESQQTMSVLSVIMNANDNHMSSNHG